MVFKQNKTLLIFEGAFAVLVVSVLLSLIKTQLFTESMANTETINAQIDRNLLLILLPLLFSPIIEEFIFRKWLPAAFDDVIGRKGAILFSNCLFALFHLDIFFLPYLVNGLIYALFYEKTKDIKVPIFMHIVYNLCVFLFTFF